MGDKGQYVDLDHLQKIGLPKSVATSFNVEAAWRKVKERFPGSVPCCPTIIWTAR
jgi:hypothetical protein